MHEFSTAQGIVETAIHFAKKNHAKKVKRVFLEVGELTFLNIEQLKFSYGILAKDTILEGSKLIISIEDALYECSECKSKGKIPKIENDNHFRMPVFHCPYCNSAVDIVSGKQCFIKNMEIEI